MPTIVRMAEAIAPDPARSALQIAWSLTGVDFSKPAVVLFLKGIGDDSNWAAEGRKQVAPHLDARTTSLAEVHYTNVNSPLQGVASGMDVLARVIAEIKRRKPGMKVFLSGVSLGAWTIGDSIAKNPAVRQAVEGAALFAHSTTADAHYPTDSGPIREFNYPGDKFAEPHAGSHEGLKAALERLYRNMGVGTLLQSLPELVTNFPLFLQFYQWRKGQHTPHGDTDKLNPAAYAWLAGSIASSLATK